MRRILPLLLVIACGGAAAAEETPAPAGVTGPSDRLDGLLDGFALGGERGPVRIAADAMEFDYKTRELTYRGAVTVTQADMTLRSDTLRVLLDLEHPDKPRQVIAEGHVQIDQGARRATGGRAVFDNAARTVTLSEEAHLHDGPNEVAGERVVVYLDEQRSVVEGGQERVRAVLYPSDSGPAGDGDGATAGDDER